MIGGGWAGISAAVGLVEAGRQVILLEAAPQLGGRARALTLAMDGVPMPLDNGQHLLIGAYRATFELLQRIGVSPGQVLSREPLSLQSVDGLALQAAALPGALGLGIGLVRARGLSWRHRWAMARFIAGLPPDRDTHWPAGMTVAHWLSHAGQPADLIERLWRPLCVGALNTPMDQACARAFARVLRDTFNADSGGSDMVLPRGSLGEVLPTPAHQWLTRHGARIHLRATCRSLIRQGDQGWTVVTDADPVSCQEVVLAVSPLQAARLLEGLAPADRLGPLQACEFEPIATAWLAWRERLALPRALLLQEDWDRHQPGQWLFDRSGDARGPFQSAAGVVISAAGQTLPLPTELLEQVGQQLGAQFGVPPPDAGRVVIERRATLRCTPGRIRFDTHSLADCCPGLALAGDWVWHAYPSTLESAVRSGDAACAWLTRGARISA